ncbi:MAG: cytochrome c [Acidobacteriaceae bacterium]|nr:cytochrome c [Acidobacteriaceae bacterium]MBV9500439.1 cytochrome c [Acidobacteriaceae bacterium]
MLPSAATLLVALTCLSLFAQSGSDVPERDKNSRLQRGREFLGLGAPPDPAAAARGEKLFARNCAFCHGSKATGAEGPNLIRSTLVLHDEKGEQIGPVVLKGRPDKGMPAFATMTPDQLYDLAEFLHQRVYETANRWGYQVQNIVTGNSQAGRGFFEAHCTACHSTTGDLAHIGSKYQPVDLQAVFLYPGTKLHVPDKLVLTLPTGERITGTLKHRDDFTISMVDNAGAVRSWPSDAVTVQIEDPLAGHLALLNVYTNEDMHNVLAYLVTLK